MCRLATGVQEKLGVMNKGVVYALWGYEAQNSDELSFREGDAITILRRKDEHETEWWWARLGDREGYVPRNLLGVSAQPRRACARYQLSSPRQALPSLRSALCRRAFAPALWEAQPPAQLLSAFSSWGTSAGTRSHPSQNSAAQKLAYWGGGGRSLQVAVREGSRTGWRWGWVRVLRVSGRASWAADGSWTRMLCPSSCVLGSSPGSERWPEPPPRSR